MMLSGFPLAICESVSESIGNDMSTLWTCFRDMSKKLVFFRHILSICSLRKHMQVGEGKCCPRDLKTLWLGCRRGASRSKGSAFPIKLSQCFLN
jgi:hypothetical protein